MQSPFNVYPFRKKKILLIFSGSHLCQWYIRTQMDFCQKCCQIFSVFSSSMDYCVFSVLCNNNKLLQEQKQHLIELCCFLCLFVIFYHHDILPSPQTRSWCRLDAVGTVPLIGSSAARCFCRYYGLIMGLISTRWPQRDANSLGWIYGKLSLGGGYFFRGEHPS